MHRNEQKCEQLLSFILSARSGRISNRLQTDHFIHPTCQPGIFGLYSLRILLCCTPDGDPLPSQPTNILISFSTKNTRLQRPECMAARGKDPSWTRGAIRRAIISDYQMLICWMIGCLRLSGFSPQIRGLAKVPPVAPNSHGTFQSGTTKKKAERRGQRVSHCCQN